MNLTAILIVAVLVGRLAELAGFFSEFFASFFAGLASVLG